MSTAAVGALEHALASLDPQAYAELTVPEMAAALVPITNLHQAMLSEGELNSKSVDLQARVDELNRLLREKLQREQMLKAEARRRVQIQQEGLKRQASAMTIMSEAGKEESEEVDETAYEEAVEEVDETADEEEQQQQEEEEEEEEEEPENSVSPRTIAPVPTGAASSEDSGSAPRRHISSSRDNIDNEDVGWHGGNASDDMEHFVGHVQRKGQSCTHLLENAEKMRGFDSTGGRTPGAFPHARHSIAGNVDKIKTEVSACRQPGSACCTCCTIVTVVLVIVTCFFAIPAPPSWCTPTNRTTLQACQHYTPLLGSDLYPNGSMLLPSVSSDDDLQDLLRRLQQQPPLPPQLAKPISRLSKRWHQISEAERLPLQDQLAQIVLSAEEAVASAAACLSTEEDGDFTSPPLPADHLPPRLCSALLDTHLALISSRPPLAIPVICPALLRTWTQEAGPSSPHHGGRSTLTASSLPDRLRDVGDTVRAGLQEQKKLAGLLRVLLREENVVVAGAVVTGDLRELGLAAKRAEQRTVEKLSEAESTVSEWVDWVRGVGGWE